MCHVAGTFYILADLSCLRGLPMHPRAADVFVDKPTEVLDDVHVAFHCLFAFGLGLAPMSLYGCDSSLCLVRITCSLAQDELELMCGRLRLIGMTKRAG